MNFEDEEEYQAYLEAELEDYYRRHGYHKRYSFFNILINKIKEHF